MTNMRLILFVIILGFTAILAQVGEFVANNLENLGVEDDIDDSLNNASININDEEAIQQAALSIIRTGRPNCLNQINWGRRFRHNWYITRFWECNRWRTNLRSCAIPRLYQPSLERCVWAWNWRWEPIRRDDTTPTVSWPTWPTTTPTWPTTTATWPTTTVTWPTTTETWPSTITTWPTTTPTTTPWPTTTPTTTPWPNTTPTTTPWPTTTPTTTSWPTTTPTTTSWPMTTPTTTPWPTTNPTTTSWPTLTTPDSTTSSPTTLPTTTAWSSNPWEPPIGMLEAA